MCYFIQSSFRIILLLIQQIPNEHLFWATHRTQGATHTCSLTSGSPQCRAPMAPLCLLKPLLASCGPALPHGPPSPSWHCLSPPFPANLQEVPKPCLSQEGHPHPGSHHLPQPSSPQVTPQSHTSQSPAPRSNRALLVAPRGHQGVPGLLPSCLQLILCLNPPTPPSSSAPSSLPTSGGLGGAHVCSWREGRV